MILKRLPNCMKHRWSLALDSRKTFLGCRNEIAVLMQRYPKAMLLNFFEKRWDILWNKGARRSCLMRQEAGEHDMDMLWHIFHFKISTRLFEKMRWRVRKVHSFRLAMGIVGCRGREKWKKWIDLWNMLVFQSRETTTLKKTVLRAHLGHVSQRNPSVTVWLWVIYNTLTQVGPCL